MKLICLKLISNLVCYTFGQKIGDEALGKHRESIGKEIALYRSELTLMGAIVLTANGNGKSMTIVDGCELAINANRCERQLTIVNFHMRLAHYVSVSL